MVKKTTTLKVFRRLTLVLAAAAALGACAPGLTPEQVQIQVQNSVAQTVEAQNNMATGVALTVSAMAPAFTPTPLPTLIPLTLPTLTPVISTVTPFVVPGGGGGGGVSKPKYSCSVWTRPFDNTAYKPGDPFDIKWIITNTGTETWVAGKDLEYLSGPMMTTHPGVELPEVKPDHSYSFTADANAPLEKGFYVMTWKLEGGFCFPYVAIKSGRPGDP